MTLTFVVQYTLSEGVYFSDKSFSEAIIVSLAVVL